MENWNWKKIGIGLGIGAALMLHPMTRRIVLWILPLGRGLDDLVAVVLLVGFVVWAISRGWIKWNKTKTMQYVNRHRNTRVKQVVVVLTALAFALIYPVTSDALFRAVMYGKALDLGNLEFTIPMIGCLLFAVGGWHIVKILDKGKLKK